MASESARSSGPLSIWSASIDRPPEAGQRRARSATKRCLRPPRPWIARPKYLPCTRNAWHASVWVSARAEWPSGHWWVGPRWPIRRREGQVLGLRSKVREPTKRMARRACRSSSRVGGLVRLPIDLEVGRESVASSKKALPSREDHESACEQQHRTGERQPRAQQCALNSRCSGFERAMQAPSQAGRGLRGPSAWMSRELEHLGGPVPLVRQNFFRCTSSSQKQGRTMAGAAMAAVVRRLAAAHARGRARTPVLAKLGMKPVARPTRLHRSPGRGTRPMATPELLPFFGTSSAYGP